MTAAGAPCARRCAARLRGAPEGRLVFVMLAAAPAGLLLGLDLPGSALLVIPLGLLTAPFALAAAPAGQTAVLAAWCLASVAAAYAAGVLIAAFGRRTREIFPCRAVSRALPWLTAAWIALSLIAERYA